MTNCPICKKRKHVPDCFLGRLAKLRDLNLELECDVCGCCTVSPNREGLLECRECRSQFAPITTYPKTSGKVALLYGRFSYGRDSCPKRVAASFSTTRKSSG